MKEPIWILIEGPDGTGKSALADKLYQCCKLWDGFYPELFHFPKHSQPWADINKVAYSLHTSLFLRAAELIDGYHRHILPALDKTKAWPIEPNSVICDRWLLSNFAYHYYGWDEDWWIKLQVWGAIRRLPDAVFILDAPYRVAAARKEIEHNASQYEQLRQAYDKILFFGRHVFPNIKRIDADASLDVIFNEVIDSLKDWELIDTGYENEYNTLKR